VAICFIETGKSFKKEQNLLLFIGSGAELKENVTQGTQWEGGSQPEHRKLV